VPEDGSVNAQDKAETFCSKLTARLTAKPYDLTSWAKDEVEALLRPDKKDPPPPQRVVIQNPDLRIGGYLDLDPGVFIMDSELGTLGLVYRLEGHFEKRAHSVIDQATYLKHLLLMDAGVDARPQRRAYTVECVLSVGSQEDLHKLKDVFRTTARETAFWHAIGANVLLAAGGEDVGEAAMSRAFSWLLANTKQWLADFPTTSPGSVLRSITLSDYRLPGERSVSLEPKTSVHLVHGQNGVGKSSTTEALELSVTGSVARLGSTPSVNYAAVIRNRHADATTKARIALDFNPPRTWSAEVEPSGVLSPLDRNISRWRFILDLDTMDKLARGGGELRAEIFYRFFPEDAGIQAALDKTRENLDRIVRALPPEIQTVISAATPEQRPTIVQSRFGWLDQTRPPSREECKDCEPLGRDALDTLRVFVPEVGKYLDTPQFRDLPHFEAVFKDFNEALERVRARAGVLAEAIQTAQQCLLEERIKNWSPGAETVSPGNWNKLVESFAERIVFADLVEKHWQISNVLSDPATRISKPALEVADVGLFALNEQELASTLPALDRLKRDYAAERDELRSQAIRFSDGPADRSEKPSEHPHLTERQIRGLDLAGETLIPPGVDSDASSRREPLGSTLHGAFTNPKQSGAFAGVTIGSPGWTDQLAAKLEAVAKALAPMVSEGDRIETRSQTTAPYIGPALRKDTLKTALDAAKTVAEAVQNAKKAFLTELRNQQFNRALNELLALFTPARWAYEDLDVKLGIAAGKENLELGISGAKDAHAELVLNTAELNVFTVALYFLAATRVPNPLGMLVFDDPLQNMDELTVTTLARGLAKLVLRLPQIQLLFLFHGEDDLERFRQEVPAAVYLLPWLAPSGVGEKGPTPIKAEPLKNTFDSELQDLGRIIKRRLVVG